MSVTIFNTDPKFPYHQSSASRTKLPRRPMIGVNAKLQRPGENVLAAILMQKIARRVS